MLANGLPKLIVILSIAIWSAAVLRQPPPLVAAGETLLPDPGDDAPLPTPEPLTRIVSGVVKDAQGPVSGAIVRVQASDNYTITTQSGAFTLGGLVATRPVTVTAWATGYYNGWTQVRPGAMPITITLRPHYTTDNPDYGWYVFEGVEGSASCGLCHTANVEWQADAHAQAAVNPRFLTMYAGTDINGNKNSSLPRDSLGKPLPPDLSQPYYGPGFKLDYPDRSGNCAACHTPLASKLEPTNTCGWSGCHSSTTAELSEEVPSSVSPLYLSGHAAEGITCEFCHKIGEVFLVSETGLPHPDKPGITSMRLYRPDGDNQLFFCTFDDVSRPADSYLPLLEESAFCAPCHYGVFDGVAGDMSVVDGVVIYNSFGEWLASPYSDPDTGRTCQDCHMASADYEYFVFPERGGLPRDPKRIHNHKMLGATDEILLQNSVTMTTTARLERDQVQVEISITNEEIVRNEMFLHLDYYVTESSGHNSEYNWWFRKRPDLIKKYCIDGTGWNPGEYAYILKEYRKREKGWRDEAKRWFAQETPISLERGHEYAAYIMNAIGGGEPFEFNGNVPNGGLIDNLPANACVEVPVWASKKGLEPVRVGCLPPQCAMLTNLSSQIEEMAVEAALTGNPRLVFQAIAHDPLTSAVLSLAEIKVMVNDMFRQNRDYLPQFEHVEV